jgi:hypothetical protein
MTADRSSGHSAAFFDRQRDYWWNEDFLELVVSRLGLRPTRSLLDVGCGLGHWSRALTRRAPGSDRERRRRPGAGLGQTGGPRRKPTRCDGNRAPGSGRAASLSGWTLRSGHVPDRPHPRGRRRGRAPRDVPGGSPRRDGARTNNLAGQVVRTSVSAQSGPRALASALAFYATCEAGRPLSARATTLSEICFRSTSPRLGSASSLATSRTRHPRCGHPIPPPTRPPQPRPARLRCQMSDGSGPVIRRAGTSLRAGGGLRVLGCLVRKVGGDGGRGVRDPQRRSLDRWRQRYVPACGEEAVAAIVGLTCFDGHVR